MKILLINPPQKYLNNFESKTDLDMQLPLGLMYLASVLEKNGHVVKILDCIIEKNADFRNINQKWVRFGIPEEQIISEIKTFDPDFVGISCRFTVQFDETIYISQLIKKINNSLPVIIGGPAATVEDKEFLQKNPTIDIIVKGEGEKTILKILEHYPKNTQLNEIKGIIYRDNNMIYETKNIDFINNIDEIPFPAYHLIDMETFFELRKKYSLRVIESKSIPIITSRGCPYNCIFCAAHLSMGKRFRAHSVEYIEKHIMFLKEKYNIKSISFEDDNVGLDQIRFEKLLDKLKEIKIKYDFPNGVRADTLNKNILKKIKESGCDRLLIAPEVGNQKVLNEIVKKNLDLKKVEEVAKLCKEEGIFLSAFYIFGFPGENKETINDTINFALKLKRKYNVGVATTFFACPLKGTELYNICKENNYLTKEVTPENLSENSFVGGGFIRTEDFTSEDLMKLKKKFTRLAYIYTMPQFLKNPKRLLKKFSSVYKVKIILKRFLSPTL